MKIKTAYKCAAAMTLALAASGVAVRAQDEKPMSRTERADRMVNAPMRTFYLKNVAYPNAANEILTGLRLMLDPSIKIYLTPDQNAITIRALPDDLALATKLIDELDRPQPRFKVSFTLRETEGSKTTSTQHVSLTGVNGQRLTLKQGTKIPVTTGSYKVGEGAQTQFTYLDIGQNFDVTVTGTADGAQLKCKVEESAVDDAKPVPGSAPDPSIRQTVTEGVLRVTFGKPATIGSLDLPGSNRHMEIEVIVERLP